MPLKQLFFLYEGMSEKLQPNLDRLISALKTSYQRDIGTLKDAGNLANRSLKA
jgi:hypothetical protein